MSLKHIPTLNSLKMRKNLAEMDEFLSTPTPRTVPEKLLRTIVPANLQIGRILFGVGFLMSGVVLFVALRHPAGFRLPIPAGAAFYLMTLIGLFLYLRGYGVWSSRFRALKTGELREAVIDDLSAANFRNNVQHYYKLSVSFPDPGGRTVSASDYIPDRLVPFFEQLQAAGSENRIDVLCAPNGAYLPLLYILTADKA